MEIKKRRDVTFNEADLGKIETKHLMVNVEQETSRLEEEPLRDEPQQQEPRRSERQRRAPYYITDTGSVSMLTQQ